MERETRNISPELRQVMVRKSRGGRWVGGGIPILNGASFVLQEASDAREGELLVLQPEHGGAVWEPELLGLPQLRTVQWIPGGETPYCLQTVASLRGGVPTTTDGGAPLQAMLEKAMHKSPVLMTERGCSG